MDDVKKEYTNTDYVRHFEEMLLPVYENLYKYIYYNTRNKALADDIMQNTLLKAYNHLSELQNTARFKTWIFIISKREMINAFKKYSCEISMDAAEYRLTYLEDLYFPEDYVLNNELRDAVVEAINSLSFEDKKIVILRYYKGLQLEKIADILKMCHSTVRTRHKSIKNKIYQYILDKGLIIDSKKK